MVQKDCGFEFSNGDHFQILWEEKTGEWQFECAEMVGWRMRFGFSGRDLTPKSLVGLLQRKLMAGT